MAEFRWAPTTPDNAAAVAARARRADVDELWAASLMTPAEAIRAGQRLSPETLTGFVNEVPVCIFGVARPSLTSDLGVPWMVGTEDLGFHAKGFLRGSREVIKAMVAKHAMLANFVDARNAKALNWLRWLGFCVEAPIPYGPFQLPFHHFFLTRP